MPPCAVAVACLLASLATPPTGAISAPPRVAPASVANASVPPAEPAAPTTGPVLRIDPLLLAEAAEVWGVISDADDPLWPGWSAASTPLLVYLPGVQDVLIDHPAPPQGFVRYRGEPSFPGWAVFVRDGETTIDLDGQNTSRDIEGVRCLVVADTLSNRRTWAESRIAAGASGEPIGFDELVTSPYDQMALVAHEAFHVHQDAVAPDKGANEFLLMSYPVLSVDNNAGFALEGDALADALSAGTRSAVRAAALRWLGVRAWRRSLLQPQCVQYEDGVEFSEGLAKYVEYRLLETLEGRTPGAAMTWAQGFHGYDDLSGELDRLRDTMTRHMRGEVNVNNAPYGTAPLRMRLYYSGMAVGVLLDLLDADWKHAIMQDGTSLTDLVVKALDPTPEELRSAMDATLASPELAHWREVKAQLAEDGAADLARLVDSIEHGPASALVLEFAPLKMGGLPMSFTPFGIRVVDEERTVFGQIPIRILPGDGFVISQTRASPLLQDSGAQRATFQLQERVERSALCEALGRSSVPTDELRDLALSLPGVDLQLARCKLRWEPERIVITLLPAS